MSSMRLLLDPLPHQATKLDRHMRAAADRKRNALSNRRAVEMSLEGRKMAL